jgi:hypothetical protein
MRVLLAALVLIALCTAPAHGQGRRGRGTPPPATKVEPAMVQCPSVLGDGVETGRSFCDVVTGRDVAGGIIVPIPASNGPVTLSFELHNRHTYSEELVKTNRGYRRYTATIGVLTMDNTLLTRAIIQNEFRTAADLFDRVSGGAGPGGVKAVAPTGSESIVVTIPAGEKAVSILGEKLLVVRPDANDTFNVPGRPIAIISNVTLEYRPAPARRAPARRR